jgi:hypothetical protein
MEMILAVSLARPALSRGRGALLAPNTLLLMAILSSWVTFSWESSGFNSMRASNLNIVVISGVAGIANVACCLWM